MTEVSKFRFSLKDITEALIKKENLNEGLWELEVEFRFTAAMAGPTEQEQLPSVIASLASFGLNKVDKPGPQVVDAATLSQKRVI